MTPAAAWQYVPVTELGDRAHVVVDGAARPGTVCTLSHWPHTPTPRRLWADTSAEIVLRARRRPGLVPGGVDVATLDHYDADGAIALALLVVAGLAERHGPLLAEAATAGDFGVVQDRGAALVAFALAAVGSAERALEILPALAARPGDFDELWGPEGSAYDAACALRDNGAVSIEEDAANDLAVVRIDEHALAGTAAGWAGAVVHRAALHSVTACSRVAQVVGRCYELHYRYESWVRLARRRPHRRVDLTALALTLTEAEADGGSWHFDGAGAITPRLGRLDGAASTLTPEQWLAAVRGTFETLDRRAPAWDPYGLTAAAVPPAATSMAG